MQTIAKALMPIGFLLSIVSSIALMCSDTLAQKVTTNYILLGMFTLGKSSLVGVICTFYKPETVAAALLITTVLVATLTYHAATTDNDYILSIPLVIQLVCVTMLSMFISSFLY